MSSFHFYDIAQPTREEIEAIRGSVLLEFGANWCGFCQAIQADLAAIMKGFPDVQHIKIEDGKGKPLGRSFRVKLWPTFVFMRDGKILHQITRPTASELPVGFNAIADY
jgi:thioredoxin 1